MQVIPIHLRVLLRIAIVGLVLVFSSGCTGPASMKTATPSAPGMTPVTTVELVPLVQDTPDIRTSPEVPDDPRFIVDPNATLPVYVRGAPFEYSRTREKHSSLAQIRVWILGSDFLSARYVQVDGRYSFVRKMSWDERRILTDKKYTSFLVLVQIPQELHTYGADLLVGNDSVTIIQKSTNNRLYIVSKPYDKSWIASEPAVKTALRTADIPDAFEYYYVPVEDPWIKINPSGNHTIGELFDVTGSTNLPEDEELIYEVIPADYQITQCQCADGFIKNGAMGIIRVQPGNNGINLWKFSVNSTDFKPESYRINVIAVIEDAIDRSTMTMISSV